MFSIFGSAKLGLQLITTLLLIQYLLPSSILIFAILGVAAHGGRVADGGAEMGGGGDIGGGGGGELPWEGGGGWRLGYWRWLHIEATLHGSPRAGLERNYNGRR